uniref:Mitochondrial carrier protein n=1 Tax=Polytomella parva TaxID=51329 RepID=A0A6U0VR38_9CHLO|mmetsp:Transcript_26307/g.48221  ORF Transcript_26307/g.48221 Transcript_26307/m.48221 type:complete len:333 (+) Transcript_26307:471-1469(+)|eukprot:CAMPEP_0175046080 /NCGR_PEP_ID=MMETSP0052_2-20121109/4822_1 /TAXON_ID=51329 ORGANISM="Polytomella parva, Strain SAG 63-3" /NCGR_SAMPLE_ID=MMETSP0052_2 /ASSEMBLY_ACC=CAM_ASM_000194 /LENGTH=332 /DNA_ID=CAMNT_0016309767 /DNA_START=453 /DNA_END=1451 /DNA_ORIENTATION=+
MTSQTMLRSSETGINSNSTQLLPCQEELHPNEKPEKKNRHKSESEPIRTYKVFLSGGLAGAISRTATAPIDRLKMLLQVQDQAKGLSIRDGLQKMRSEGTISAYFRGNGANVLKIAPETALKLTLNDSIRHFISNDDPKAVTVSDRMISGAIAGAIAQGLLYPVDTIRTRLATSPHGMYRGILHTAYKIRRDECMRAFYRGLLPSTIGVLPFSGVDIALFEILKGRLLDAYDGSPPHAFILGAGMISSSLGQIVSYPLALVRTRLQAQRREPDGKLKYTGMRDVFRKTLEREGPRGLYKGLLPNILKLAPAAGISWYVFEETKLVLGVDPRS